MSQQPQNSSRQIKGWHVIAAYIVLIITAWLSFTTLRGFGVPIVAFVFVITWCLSDAYAHEL